MSRAIFIHLYLRGFMTFFKIIMQLPHCVVHLFMNTTMSSALTCMLGKFTSDVLYKLAFN
jgi:hypothetical protein